MNDSETFKNSGWCLLSIHFHERLPSRPQSLRCDLAVPASVSQRSNAFRVIRLIVLATQLTAIIYAGSRATCCSFFLCFNRLSRPGRSLLRTESAISLYSYNQKSQIRSLYSRAMGTLQKTSFTEVSLLLLE
jgi:hypothetical protein